MHPFPHHYRVSARAGAEGEVTLGAEGLPALPSDAPAEFDGPGDHWSPESLLTAAVVDCLILSFRAVARASKLDWTSIDCEAVGTLERVEGVNRFTRFDIEAKLTLPAGGDTARGEKLLEKAEQLCLVTNSLTAEHSLTARVEAG